MFWCGGLGEIVGPVDDVEAGEADGKHDPGYDIDSLEINNLNLFPVRRSSPWPQGCTAGCRKEPEHSEPDWTSAS